MKILEAALNMKEMLYFAAEQFRSYQGNHLLKGTPEALLKAKTNEMMAKRCEQAIKDFEETTLQ